MHSLKYLLSIFLICAASSHGADEGSVEIGVRRPDAAPVKILPEHFQAAIQRVLKAPAPVPPHDQSEAVLALVTEIRSTPELFLPLLTPPGFPNAVPKSDKVVRLRVATLMGLSADRRCLQTLINSAVYDPEETVRIAAGQAIPKLEEPSAIRKLMDIAIAKDARKYPWHHRKAAAAALRRYGDLYVIERLLKELSYELAGGNILDVKNRPRGRQSGLATDNPLMIPDSAPANPPPPEDMYPVLHALKEVTRAELKHGDNEKDVRSWQAWWRNAKPAFKFQD